MPRGDGADSHRCLLQELSQGACVLGNLLSHSRGMWGCVQRMQKNDKESQLVPLSTANFPVSLGHCAVSFPPTHTHTTKRPQAQGSTASFAHILLEVALPVRQQQRQERWVRNSQEASCPSLSVLLKMQEHQCHLKMSNMKYQGENHT